MIDNKEDENLVRMLFQIFWVIIRVTDAESWLGSNMSHKISFLDIHLKPKQMKPKSDGRLMMEDQNGSTMN